MDRQATVQALEAARTEDLERPVTGLSGEVRVFDALYLDRTMLETLMALENSIGRAVDPEEPDADDLPTVDTSTGFVEPTLRTQVSA